jgi:hypothetical protein
MSALSWGLLFALAALAVLALAVLATPVKLEFTMRSSPRRRVKIAARLLGGLTPPIVIHDSDRQGRKAKHRQAVVKPGRRERGKMSRQALARVRRAIIAAPHLLADLLRPIHIEQLTADADIGLADPADTGQVFGLLAPVIYSRLASDVLSIAVRPDFMTPGFSGEVFAKLSVTPVAFIAPATRFAWHIFGPRS